MILFSIDAITPNYAQDNQPLDYDPFADENELPASSYAEAMQFISENDDVRELWEQVVTFSAAEFMQAVLSGATPQQILAADGIQLKAVKQAGVESRRDTREAIKQQHDGRDIVDIAHERGDSLESFAPIAALMAIIRIRGTINAT